MNVCLADLTCDGAVNFDDYLDFVQPFQAGAAAMDVNEDGVLDLFDYLDFLTAFTSGC